jgi:hypothetical protein
LHFYWPFLVKVHGVAWSNIIGGGEGGAIDEGNEDLPSGAIKTKVYRVSDVLHNGSLMVHNLPIVGAWFPMVVQHWARGCLFE